MPKRVIFIILVLGFSHISTSHQSEDISTEEEGSEAPRITEQPADTIVARHLPATLNCRATGSPTPTIRWFKDGLPIRLGGGPHRVQLPTGELFFLRVSHGRQHSDAGVYSCEASNSHGTVVSRMASLQVAVLREEFRLEPVSTRAAQGDTILLECAPPRGTPEPKVSWKKNGENLPLESSSRLRIVDGGNLVIQNIKQTDEGRYQCVASNSAGTRESVTAMLNVHIKPYIIIGPQDTTALTGSSVKFQCQVGGDPLPDVLWRRSAGGGNMPLGRVHILEDRSLRLDAITTSDSGFYTCEADNAIGGVYASGYLEVHSIPNFTIQPTETIVEPGSQTSFNCCAIGNPLPTLFWSIEYERFLLFPGTTLNKYSAIRHKDGTSSLIIKNVTMSNNDTTIICSAVNQAGAAITKAKLLVVSKVIKFPPIIEIGPSNQTHHYHATALLHCNASGQPKPTISWYHNGSAVISSKNIVINVTGDLIIKDLGLNDNGLYTCVASSSNGKYAWSAVLDVQSEMYSKIPNDNIENILKLLPPKPTRPEILKFSQTHVTIVWTMNDITSSNIIGYRIEMFEKAHNDMQWSIVANKISDSIFTYHIPHITNTYWFFVRAENKFGFSIPSDISDEINIKFNSSENLSISNDIEGQSFAVLDITNSVALDAQSIKLSWKVLQVQRLHGFYIYYGPKNTTDPTNWKYLEITLLTSVNTNSFVIRQLRKFTTYELFLVPFFENIIGKPSNSRYVQTLEDVPEHPPTNIEGVLYNSSTVRLEWQIPPLDKRNGIIIYYEIIVTLIDKVLNQTVLVANVTNKSEGTVFLLTNLTSGIMYSVQIAAATKAGLGPFSTPAILKLNSPETDISYPMNKSLRPIPSEDLLSETWFLTLILSMATILAMLCAVIFAVKYRHILMKNSTVPEIYEHTSYGANLVTHMKSAVGIPHPLENTFCQTMTKPNTFLWSGLDGSLKNSNLPDYNYKPDYPPDYDKQANPNVADYAEVESNATGFRIQNIDKKTPSPAAYASVLIVDNNLPGSRCWIQNKFERNSNSANELEDDEDIYPAYNGGYYNRNVYYDNYSKNNSIVVRNNDFSNTNYNSTLSENVMGHHSYSEDDDSKNTSSGPTSSDGSCLIPSYLCKPSQSTIATSNRNAPKDNIFFNFGVVNLAEENLNTYQEIKTPDPVSGEISINNSSSENSDPYFSGSIQPMKLLGHRNTQSSRKVPSKSNLNVLGSFTMHKTPFLKSEYHSSTKSEPGK